MVRRRVLGLVALGFVGTAVELWLLAQDEDVQQWIPFLVIAVALTAIAWWWRSAASRAAVRGVRATMVIVIITGAAGVVLHYRANMEFQLELDPSLGGVALMKKVLEAKSPPALAPGNMSLLGLLGLVAVSRERAGG